MNDHSHDYQPPTLREVLDRGEDLATYVSMSSFVEELAEVETIAPKALSGMLSGRSVPGESNEQKTRLLWALEIVDQPDLMPRVSAALPHDAADDLRQRVYEAQHEHPLEVGFPVDAHDEPTYWSCYNCGAKHDASEAEALIIGSLVDDGRLEYPLYYCRSCIAMAAASFEVETSQ